MATMRADTIRHSANDAKAGKIMTFVGNYRECCAAIATAEWRTFNETGKFSGRFANTSRFNTFCGAAPAQMAYAQVRPMLKGFVSNRQNEFREAVQRSSLPADVKPMLHTINSREAWHQKGEVVMSKTGEIIPPEIRRLALSIWRQIRKRHRLPNARGIAPVLDDRVAKTAAPKHASSADLWATFKFKGVSAFSIPLHTNDRWRNREGKRCNVIQIVPNDAGFGVRLITDMAEAFEKSRAEYAPRSERLGIDFGLATLIATDRGDLMGRGFLDAMRRFDRQISGIARHRMRSGGKPRDSRRYRDLVTRVRGLLKTRINTALNRLVEVHAPHEIAVERLDFRMPGLSRRLNRIITNCGRAVFRAKLQDLEERFGIVAHEIPSPYTSQECSNCHYVDRRNRRSQSEFLCRSCGMQKHADVNAACTVKGRRSAGLGDKFLTKGAVLAALVRRFCERRPRSQGAAADPRLTNPHFRAWSNVARNALETQGLAVCA